MAKALIGRDGRAIMQVVANGQEFPVHPSLRWVNCPPNVRADWIYDGQSFTPPTPEPLEPPAPPSRLEQLITTLKAKGIITDADLR